MVDLVNTMECEECGNPHDPSDGTIVTWVHEDATDSDTGQHYILDAMLCESCYQEATS